MPCDSGPGAADLWAMAAELERQYAGYKQRLAERTTTGAATAARDHDGDDYGDAVGDGAKEEGDGDEAAGGGLGGGGGDVRGRMYEAYVRRRDERLRDGWRGAERAVPAGGDPTTTTTTSASPKVRRPFSSPQVRRRHTSVAEYGRHPNIPLV